MEMEILIVKRSLEVMIQSSLQLVRPLFALFSSYFFSLRLRLARSCSGMGTQITFLDLFAGKF